MLDQAILAKPLPLQASPRQMAAVEAMKPESGGVAESARIRLRDSAYPGVRVLRCEYHEGVLVIQGRVASFHHKQVAQETVRVLAGVEMIINKVEVFKGSHDTRPPRDED